MMPLYLEPAIGFSSTVALRLLIEPAVELNFSSNSSRVASLTTGFSARGGFLTPLTWPPQAARMSARVANDLRCTDGAKSVARIGVLIGIEPAFGEFAFAGGIGRLGRRADAHAEGFGFE